jgi:3'-phosphoadenosine 5'-phosphosulfate sulfotransferase (PAPS reductase)/FAD synthetase
MHESKPHSGHKPNGLRWVFKKLPGSPDFVQPLREWTNQDVFEYSNVNDLPFNDKVYYRENGEFLPLPNPTYNPDRRPACWECMLPSNDMSVFCPKLQSLTNNVSEYLEKTIMPTDYKNYQVLPCLQEDK